MLILMLRVFRSKKSPLLFVFFVCFLFSFTQARAAWRTAGDIKSVKKLADGAELELTSGARVIVRFVMPDAVRVRLAPNGKFERDFSYAVEEKMRPMIAAKVSESKDEIGISVTNGARVVIKRRPFLVTVLDEAGNIVCDDDAARPAAFDAETGAVEASKKRSETEIYYGFGEKALPISRHEQFIANWNTDTFAYPTGLDPIYQTHPFYVALLQGKAYGLFFDNTFRSYFDTGKTDPARLVFGASGGELNYYVFTGGRERSPRNVVRDYTDLTGRAPLPPLWALGYQQSRWSYYPESLVRELAKKFRDEKVPADVIYLDIGYMRGYRIFTWDESRFPDPSKMLADLRAQGFRVVTIVDPGVKVDADYEIYKNGQEANVFVKDAQGGELHANVWPGACVFPDFTDSKARLWFGDLYKSFLDAGVAGFWNDMNEPATFLPENLNEPQIYHHPRKTFPLNAQHAGDGLPGTHARYHNVYGQQMARATFEGLKRLRPNSRPFVLTRAGYAGVQRYAAVWTGDNVASWDHLALTIPMLINMGVSGVPFVGADIGGFAGNPTPELYTRWLEAAALAPLMRSHVEAGQPDREPWMHGEPYTSINRKTIELRYQLLPYLYSLFHEHTETGAPVMRPLAFEYPQDVRTYLIDDEFLVGRDLLVAPVVGEGERKRRVYFPKGDDWVDWRTGARYEGGKSYDVDAPLEALPLFARIGAAIPTQAVVQNTDEMRSAPLGVVASLGGDFVSKIYQDAGEGDEYKNGAYRAMSVAQLRNEMIIARSGMSGRALSYIEIIGLNAPPAEIRVNNRVVTDAAFDAERRRVRFALPDETALKISVQP